MAVWYWKCCDFNSFSSLASLCVSFHASPLHSPNTLHLRLETYYCCSPFIYKRFKEFRAAHTKGNMNSISFFVRRNFRATLAWWEPSHDVHSVCQLILYDMRPMCLPSLLSWPIVVPIVSSYTSHASLIASNGIRIYSNWFLPAHSAIVEHEVFIVHIVGDFSRFVDAFWFPNAFIFISGRQQWPLFNGV